MAPNPESPMPKTGTLFRLAGALGLTLALAACGVEGPPQPPQTQGLTVGGTLTFGVGATGG